jgi:hypothetical protein
MRADSFIKHLKLSMPSRELLAEYGLDEDEISDIQTTFTANSKKVSSHSESDEVLKMIEEYDCSKIEVGLVRFIDSPIPHAFGTIFAYCEADFLVLQRDGSIALYDHAAPETKLFDCALNSSHLLDGLAEFIDIRQEKSKWQGRIEDAVLICSNAAGGGDYKDFFRLLCSFIG